MQLCEIPFSLETSMIDPHLTPIGETTNPNASVWVGPYKTGSCPQIESVFLC